MGFWIFMLAMDMIIPIVMIFIGARFTKGGPKEINKTSGYRTKMSMKNRDTWEFAHKCFGKAWRTIGILLAPITIVSMLLIIDKDIAAIGIVGGVVCGIQFVIMILPCITTELALRRIFDGEGHRIK